jgi:hypothetical protein
MLMHLNFLELGLILPKPGQRLDEWRGNMNPLIEGLSGVLSPERRQPPLLRLTAAAQRSSSLPVKRDESHETQTSPVIQMRRRIIQNTTVASLPSHQQQQPRARQRRGSEPEVTPPSQLK